MGMLPARTFSGRRVLLLLALALGLPVQSAQAGIPERLKWVRGTTASVTADGLTTRFHGKTLLVSVDGAAVVIRLGASGPTFDVHAPSAVALLPPGEPIEVHYRDTQGVRTARYVWVGIPLDASESTRPSTSAAGVVTDVTPRWWIFSPYITVASGPDHRSFHVRSSTLISGSVQPNDRVVIAYKKHKSGLTARLVRRIPTSSRAQSARSLDLISPRLSAPSSISSTIW